MNSFLFYCDVGWHEGPWVIIYKGVEVQEVKMMNRNAKNFVCIFEGGVVLKH